MFVINIVERLNVHQAHCLNKKFSQFCASLSPVEGTINPAMEGISQGNQ